jgi:hypothetical protein
VSFGKAVRKLFFVGGWAPLAVLLAHVLMSSVFHAYRYWPKADVEMHFMGGMAMAYFFSGAFQALPRDAVRSSRIVLLELILVGALTTTVAVLWEFGEFILDRIFGTNVQISLANTMQDLAMGMAGALVILAVRAHQLRAGRAELREVAGDWVAGTASARLIR